MPRKKLPAPESSPELLPALPGSNSEDTGLVETAVHELNTIYIRHGLAMHEELGAYVEEKFFGGDADRFEALAGEHVSFQKLTERDDLRVSKSTLYYAVKYRRQRKLLPEGVRDALPFSHHRLLLPVKDERAKEKLAKSAVEKDWTVKQLAAAVRKVKPKSNAGRPELPAFVKLVTRLQGITHDLDADGISDEQLMKVGLKKAEQKLKALSACIEDLQKYAVALENRIKAVELSAK